MHRIRAQALFCMTGTSEDKTLSPHVSDLDRVMPNLNGTRGCLQGAVYEQLGGIDTKGARRA